MTERRFWTTSRLSAIFSATKAAAACLGKRFISDCMKRQLPPELLEGLLAEFNLTPSLLLDRIYREPLANRFLAGFTPYIYKYRKKYTGTSFSHQMF